MIDRSIGRSLPSIHRHRLTPTGISAFISALAPQRIPPVRVSLRLPEPSMRHHNSARVDFSTLFAARHPSAFNNDLFDPLRANTRQNPTSSGQGFSGLKRSLSDLSLCSDSSNASSVTSYQHKHLTRAWDNFWAKHIVAPNNHVRRHIVMAKAFKDCIAKMHEHVDQSADPQLARRLSKLYADCLNQYKNTDSYKETDDLTRLEADLFHTLHNLRFNIFLGGGPWNSAISDCAGVLGNNEASMLQAIETANSHEDLDNALQDWFDDAVELNRTFRIPDYNRARQDLRDNIQEIALPTPPAPREPLEDRKDLLKGLILSFYDSLTCDISEAGNTDLRRWQNKVLPTLHGQFLDLKKTPDLDQYEKTLTAFIRIDEAGAKILGINLDDLSASAPNSESLQKFQHAITAPKNSGSA